MPNSSLFRRDKFDIIRGGLDRARTYDLVHVKHAL